MKNGENLLNHKFLFPKILKRRRQSPKNMVSKASRRTTATRNSGDHRVIDWPRLQRTWSRGLSQDDDEVRSARAARLQAAAHQSDFHRRLQPVPLRDIHESQHRCVVLAVDALTLQCHSNFLINVV